MQQVPRTPALALFCQHLPNSDMPNDMSPIIQADKALLDPNLSTTTINSRPLDLNPPTTKNVFRKAPETGTVNVHQLSNNNEYAYSNIEYAFVTHESVIIKNTVCVSNNNLYQYITSATTTHHDVHEVPLSKRNFIWVTPPGYANCSKLLPVCIKFYLFVWYRQYNN